MSARVLRLVAVLVGVGLLAASCSSADRPEGTVERFADAVSRGVDTNLIDELGSEQAAEDLLGEPFEPSDRDQENLDAVEVAPATEVGTESARVPVSVVRASDPDERVELEARLTRRDGAWYITSFDALREDVVFPGEGGPGLVDNKGRLAILTGLVFLGSLVFTTLMIRVLGGKRPDDLHKYEELEPQPPAQ